MPEPLPTMLVEAIERAHTHQVGLNEADPPTELLICLSADCSVEIDVSVGSSDRVQLTEKMLKAANSEGCRLVHNHPTRGSLSAADWRLALAQPGILEIVAVNHRKSIFRGAPSPTQDGIFASLVVDSDLASQVGADVFQPMWTTFNRALARGDQLPDPSPLQYALEWVWSHLVNERFRLKGYIQYQASLSPTDLADLTSLSFTTIIQDGRDKIAAAIV